MLELRHKSKILRYNYTLPTSLLQWQAKPCLVCRKLYCSKLQQIT